MMLTEVMSLNVQMLFSMSSETMSDLCVKTIADYGSSLDRLIYGVGAVVHDVACFEQHQSEFSSPNSTSSRGLYRDSVFSVVVPACLERTTEFRQSNVLCISSFRRKLCFTSVIITPSYTSTDCALRHWFLRCGPKMSPLFTIALTLTTCQAIFINF